LLTEIATWILGLAGTVDKLLLCDHHIDWGVAARLGFLHILHTASFFKLFITGQMKKLELPTVRVWMTLVDRASTVINK
jgi:hypothetical protein